MWQWITNNFATILQISVFVIAIGGGVIGRALNEIRKQRILREQQQARARAEAEALRTGRGGATASPIPGTSESPARAPVAPMQPEARAAEPQRDTRAQSVPNQNAELTRRRQEAAARFRAQLAQRQAMRQAQGSSAGPPLPPGATTPRIQPGAQSVARSAAGSAAPPAAPSRRPTTAPTSVTPGQRDAAGPPSASRPAPNRPNQGARSADAGPKGAPNRDRLIDDLARRAADRAAGATDSGSTGMTSGAGISGTGAVVGAASTIVGGGSRGGRRSTRIAKLLSDRDTLRHAIVLNEVLGPPRSSTLDMR